MYTRTNLI